MGKVTLLYHLEKLREADLRAVELATETLSQRLDLLNELRGNVLTREEYNAKHDAMEAEITVLRDRINIATGKGIGLNSAWVIVVAVITILIALASVTVFLVTRGA